MYINNNVDISSNDKTIGSISDVGGENMKKNIFEN